MTAPRARERSDPPSPPDRRPPRRGGGSSPSTSAASAAGRAAGPARLRRARHGLVRPGRALTAAALVALSGALALPATAQAEVLVSNIDKQSSGVNSIEVGGALGQRFTTGPGSSPHSLTSIDVKFDRAPTSTETLTATVRLADGDDNPGEVHATLEPTASIGRGNNRFTVPMGTTLAAETKYFVVIETDGLGGTNAALDRTSKTAEDGVPGWSIENRRRSEFSGGWSFINGSPFQIRVNGTGTGPPSVTGAEVSTDGRTIALTFSKDLDYPTNTGTLRDDAFSVTVDGTASQIAGFSGFENVVTLTMSRRIGAGQTVVVSYDQSDAGSDALEDSDNQEVADFTTGRSGVPAVDNNSTLNTTPPALTTAAVPTTGASVGLTFNESVVSAVGNLPAALRDAFTVTVDGVERRVTGLTASTLNNVQVAVESTSHAGQTVTVSYDASAAGSSALADGAGNDVVSFTTGEDSVPAVTNNSTVASAKLTSATVNAAGTELTLTFDKDLNTVSTGIVSQFTITVDGAEIDFVGSQGFSSADDNFKLLFQSSNPIYKDEAVVVTYEKPAGSDGLTDEEDDLSVVSFTTGENNVPAVTNNSGVYPPPTLTSAEVQTRGDEIYLGFSEGLDVPATVAQALKDAFTVTVDGVERQFDDLEFFGLGDSFVKLVFTTAPIQEGTAVVVSYDESAGGTSAIEGGTATRSPTSPPARAVW